QKISARGNIIKKVADTDARTNFRRDRLLPPHFRSLYEDKRSYFSFCKPCLEFHLRYCSKGSKCLSPEAHGSKGKQILGFSDLGSGMALQAHPCIRLRHPDTVVDHLDQYLTCILDN